CDLTTLDSMIQRFGRVNRLGRDDESFVSCIEVFDGPEAKKINNDNKDDEDRRAATREALSRLPSRTEDRCDASPRALRQILDPITIKQAFAASPRVVPCTDVLLDAWALTSLIELPGRPPVDRWLHGVEDNSPETVVLWRDETQILAKVLQDKTGFASKVEDW